ncbi:MAG: bifunctional folylpolyglutamate synthase/dihydrofolate synthase [Chitinophagaceae bacterium]
MNYQQTLDYLFNKLPMFSRIGAAAFKKDLTNTIRLCEALDNPQNNFKTIHIAGTNGKGSVSHMLSAILQTAGYKVGLYTSPHLKDFRERIKLNGKMCEENFVIGFVEKIKPLIEEIEPSFFEITVAMAFDYFAQQKVDIAVIEVGLGGRLDSTNIITPILSVITNIGWDHMNMLGDSLQKIAFEKAGIIKQNIPVVIGEVIKETQPVFEEIADQKKAPLIYAQQKRYVTDWFYEHHQLQVTVADKNSDERQTYHLDLTGIYQIKNLVTVLEVVHQLKLKDWKIDHEIIFKSFSHVKKLTGLHGRWEVIHQHPTIILDVAHNEDGIKQIAEQLELINYQKLHIIIGIVKDKDIKKILSYLPKTADYYFTKAQIPRALPEIELAEIAAGIGLQGIFFTEINIAINSALKKAQTNDLILICGSVFLVGEVDVLSIKK